MKYDSKIVNTAEQCSADFLGIRAELRSLRFKTHVWMDLRPHTDGELLWGLIPTKDGKFEIYYRDKSSQTHQDWKPVHSCSMGVRYKLGAANIQHHFTREISHYIKEFLNANGHNNFGNSRAWDFGLSGSTEEAASATAKDSQG